MSVTPLITLTRRRDWRTRLHRWSAAQVGRKYVWGETDCGSLAREALVQMFGDALRPHLPVWKSGRGALAVLRAHAAGARLEMLGAERMALGFMRSGDILVAVEPEERVGRVALMVCIDAQQCLTSTRRGVVWSDPMPEAVAYSLWTASVPRG